MKTLKETIYNILLNQPETRDSRHSIIWETYSKLGFTYNCDSLDNYIRRLDISEADFKRYRPESIRRCSQALQRTDLLSGKCLIQPTKSVKEKRVKLSKSKGFEYQEGKQGRWEFDQVTNSYKEI